MSDPSDSERRPEGLAGRASQVSLPILTDPDNVSVRIVDGITSVAVIGTTIMIGLATNRMGRLTNDGNAQDEYVVAARLRMSPEIARLIRDALDSQLSILAKPNGQAN